MSETRRALALDGRGQLHVVEQPAPEPKPGQVLVRVHASLISPGTELGRVPRLREHPTDAPPRVFGYANAGEIISVADGVRGLEVGMRVGCMGGGYAEHASLTAVPQNMAIPLPDDVSYAQASFACLAATALHAVRRGEVQLGENALVVGLGIVGQMAAQLLRIAGCHVMGWDRLPLRLDCAEKCGADAVVDVTAEDPVARADDFSHGYGMDCAIIAFGGDASEAFKQIVQSMKLAPDTHRYGRVVVVGGARIETGWAASIGNIDVRSSARPGPGYHDEAWEHGADYPPVFVPWTTQRNLMECIRWIEEGKLRVEPLITHRVPLSDGPQACEDLVQHPDRSLGVVLEPEQ